MGCKYLCLSLHTSLIRSRFEKQLSIAVIMSAEVSHGRGGAGNINPDDTQYIDGSIVRAGPEGSHGAYSAGRGGAGNIGDAGVKGAVRSDSDIIPDVAKRSEEAHDHHTGRGGAGNEERSNHVNEHKSVSPVGLADKLKNKLFGKK